MGRSVSRSMSVRSSSSGSGIIYRKNKTQSHSKSPISGSMKIPRKCNRFTKKKKHSRSKTLEIRKLTSAVTKEHVLEIFSAYGSIRSLDICTEYAAAHATNNFQQATVEYESHLDARLAKKNLNGGMIDRQEITVEVVSKKDHRHRV